MESAGRSTSRRELPAVDGGEEQDQHREHGDSRRRRGRGSCLRGRDAGHQPCRGSTDDPRLARQDPGRESRSISAMPPGISPTFHPGDPDEDRVRGRRDDRDRHADRHPAGEAWPNTEGLEQERRGQRVGQGADQRGYAADPAPNAIPATSAGPRSPVSVLVSSVRGSRTSRPIGRSRRVVAVLLVTC